MKKLALLALLAVMIVLVASCGGDKDSEPKTVVLKLAHGVSENLPVHQAFTEFAAAVEERTEGAVTIDVYSSGSLGNERELFEGMQLGTVDFGYIATAVAATFVPDYYVFDAPFLFKDTKSIMSVCDSEIGDALGEKLLKTQGIHQIGFMDVGGRNIFSTKPIASLADFEGVKIRTMENNLHIALFNMLGAQATPMAFTELYTALQQGTVDAGENALQGITGSKFDDICKYVTITNHIYGVNIFAMASKALEKIPEDYKDIVLEEAWKCVINERALVAAANERATDELKANDCEIYTLDNAMLATEINPIYEKFGEVLPLEIISQVKEFLAKNN